MKIPGRDNFGNITAQPGPREQVDTSRQANADPNAYGAGVGRALEQAGTIGMNAAQQDINAQNAEAKRLQREQAAEAKATAREAARVKALTTTAQVNNGLQDLQDQIDEGMRTGTIPKDKAMETFTTQAEKLKSTALEGVDVEHRGLVDATLLDNVSKGRMNVTKLVRKKDQGDILAGGLSYIEEMQRYAARGPKQADEAIANVSTFWTATGPQAGEDPQVTAKRVQQFTENVRSRQATELVNVDPRAAMKALKDPNYLPQLDPDKRTALIHSADTAVLRQQQRAEVQAQAYARKMDTEWKAASTVLEAGKSFTPEYAAQLTKQFKGTPYAAALGSLMADGPANAAFVTQPVAKQTESLFAMQAKLNTKGASPDDIKSYERADKAHKATLADIKEDPYKAAAERGVLTALSPLTMDLNALPGQLAKRAEDAQVVSTWTGKPESLFRPEEANKVAEVLSALPPKDRAGAMQGLSKAMTPGQMRAFAKQLGSKDETLAAAAILSANDARTTSGRLVSEIALAGADAQKEQRVKFPTGMSQTTVRAEIDKATRGAFLSENAQRAAGDAAMAVYSGLLSEGDSPSVKQAVDLATGGVMEINGQKITKPWGWKDAQVLKSLRDYDAPKLATVTGGKPVKVGDQDVSLDELARYIPGAQLGPSPRPNAYTISIGGRLVSDATGKPLYLPLTGTPE